MGGDDRMVGGGLVPNYLWLPGQQGPTQAPLTVPHKFQAPASTIKAQLPRFELACQQSATSSKQDHLHFRSPPLPITPCIE